MLSGFANFPRTMYQFLYELGQDSAQRFPVLLGFASDGIKQPRRLADVGRHKTSESVNRNQRKKDRVSELTWKYTISARRPFVSGNSFSQGSGTSATRSRFLQSQKRQCRSFSSYIPTFEERFVKEACRPRRAKLISNVTFCLPIFQIISRYFNDPWRGLEKSSA